MSYPQGTLRGTVEALESERARPDSGEKTGSNEQLLQELIGVLATALLQDQGPLPRPEAARARLAEYVHFRESGFNLDDAGRAAGVGRTTAYRYERLRAQGAV
jgi:hypothetical protein